MKRVQFVFSLLAILFLMGPWVSQTHAASSANVTVTVTIQNLSVSLSDANWSIGTISASSVVDMTSSQKITVTNDGNVPENFTLRLTDPTGWTAGSTAGAEIYVMKGLFVGTSDSVVTANFGGDDVITTTPQTATTAVFNYAGSSANGASVPPLGARALWLQFSAPTATSVDTSQSIVITVGATP